MNSGNITILEQKPTSFTPLLEPPLSAKVGQPNSSSMNPKQPRQLAFGHRLAMIVPKPSRKINMEHSVKSNVGQSMKANRFSLLHMDDTGDVQLERQVMFVGSKVPPSTITKAHKVGTKK